MLKKICSHCKKSPATVHLTEVVNQVQNEIHLCANCAEEKGIKFNPGVALGKLFDDKIFNSLLGKIEKKSGAKSKPKPKEDESGTVCPHCRLTWEKYRETGRLGCRHDYEVFSEQIRPMINDLHCSPERYVGKSPHPNPRTLHQQQRLEYQRRLKEAIAKEDYHSAARIRDVLTSLEKEPAEDA